MAKNSSVMIPQPPYSPDLVPYEFQHLMPQVLEEKMDYRMSKEQFYGLLNMVGKKFENPFISIFLLELIDQTKSGIF